MMQKSKFFILLLTISIVFFSCKTEHHAINVIPLNKAQGIRNYSNLYALPKTVIRVNVSFTQTIYKQGPYNRYAKSMLGIDQIVNRNFVEWSIDKVDFKTFAIPDTNHIYLIEQAGGINNIGLSLTSCGLINSVNADWKHSHSFLTSDNKKYTSTLNFNKEEEQLNKTNIIDFNDVPILKDVASKKTSYEKAKALAEKIYTLREDRAAILVGDGYSEAMPDGLALKKIVENLNDLEQRYLSMFVGRQLTRQYTYSFDFTPDSPKKITQSILFRYSASRGIVSFNDVSGLPVIIEINSFQNINRITKFDENQNRIKRIAEIDEKAHGLYYRIPEMGLIKLLIDEKVIAEKKLMIAQFGEVHPLDPSYLDGRYSIEFYPELGSIKQISKIKE